MSLVVLILQASVDRALLLHIYASLQISSCVGVSMLSYGCRRNFNDGYGTQGCDAKWLAIPWLRMTWGQRDVKRWALRGSLKGVVGCRCDASGCEKKFEGICGKRCNATGCRNLNQAKLCAADVTQWFAKCREMTL